MALSSLDQLISGAVVPSFFLKKIGTAGYSLFVTSWARDGIPGAGSYSTSLAGAALSQTGGAVAGAMTFIDPPGGQSSYLTRFFAVTNENQIRVLLCDRLWHNGGFTITSTGAQTVNSVTFPARDNAGTTDGAGVMLALECSSGTGSGTPNITISYTNSAGTSGRTATNLEATENNTATGKTYFFQLQAGDVGVRSVQSLTLDSSWSSGTINLVAFRPLAETNNTSTWTLSDPGDAMTLGMPQLFDGTCPYIYVRGPAGGMKCMGQIGYSQG